MKYLSENIRIRVSTTKFWDCKIISTEKIVNKRLYSIKRNQDKIVIKRQFLDIFDTMGMEMNKFYVLAEGKINNTDSEVQLNLKIKLRPLPLFFTRIYITLLAMILLLSIFKNIESVFLILVGVILALGMWLLFFTIASSSLSDELKRDLQEI